VIDKAEIDRRIATVDHWYHRIEVAPGVVTPGSHDSPAALALTPLPEDMGGMRVLDIGARDGFFSFEMERRGAEVIALDYVSPDVTGFAVASELLGSKVDYRVENVYGLDPARHGTFDLVLFLGVLYHLRNPLLALDRIWEVCRGDLILESHVIDEAVLAPDGTLASLADLAPGLADGLLMQFYPGRALLGDPTNAWAPTHACLVAMVEEAVFDVWHEARHGTRGIVAGRRSEDPDRVRWRESDAGLLR
jgi:tRNA (mo5U34)-methyltransferase